MSQKKSIFNDDFVDFINSIRATKPNPMVLAPIPFVFNTEAASTVTAATTSTSSGSGTTTAAVTASSVPAPTLVGSGSGLQINLVWDATVNAAPASFKAAIIQAAQILCSDISNKIQINIGISCTGTGGGATAGPFGGLYLPYSTVKSNLISHEAAGDTTFNALPTGPSVQGQSYVAVWSSELKLWGQQTSNTALDGAAVFATDINANLLTGVALHELTHVMGRVNFGSIPDIFDLFRYTAPGSMLFTGGSTAQASYFSINGGTTALANYGQKSDPSDFLNTGVQGSTDPFNESYSSPTAQNLSAIDLEQLDALGYTIVKQPTLSNVTGIPTGVTAALVGTNGNLNFHFGVDMPGTPSATRFDTITGWSGYDTITFTTPLTVVGNSGAASAGMASINASTGFATFSSADNTLALQLAAVEKAIAKGSNTAAVATGDVVMWANGANTFVLITGAHTGTAVGAHDTLIELVGVNTAHVALANGTIVV